MLNPQFAGYSQWNEFTPRWCELNHARLPIPPYLLIKLKIENGKLKMKVSTFA